jgi:hypothetical protein
MRRAQEIRRKRPEPVETLAYDERPSYLAKTDSGPDSTTFDRDLDRCPETNRRPIATF